MTISEEEAIEIAREDAETVYDGVSEFAVTATCCDWSWAVASWNVRGCASVCARTWAR